MEIRKDLSGDVLTLELEGDFDTTETENFSAEISEALEAGNLRVLLDLTELEFVNSTALGTLLRSQKRLSQLGGGLAAVGARPGVLKTLRLLELDRRIPQFSSREEAREHLLSLEPESVESGGEDIRFRIRQSGETEPPWRRGRIVEIHESGLTFSFDNLEGREFVDVLSKGVPLSLRFSLPLYHPTYVFDVDADVDRRDLEGGEAVSVHVSFRDLSDSHEAALRQYVKDLRYLKDEI